MADVRARSCWGTAGAHRSIRGSNVCLRHNTGVPRRHAVRHAPGALHGQLRPIGGRSGHWFVVFVPGSVHLPDSLSWPPPPLETGDLLLVSYRANRPVLIDPLQDVDHERHEVEAGPLGIQLVYGGVLGGVHEGVGEQGAQRISVQLLELGDAQSRDRSRLPYHRFTPPGQRLVESRLQGREDDGKPQDERDQLVGRDLLVLGRVEQRW